MARSINLVLACVAMLAAAGLAYAMKPHRLMARTHEAFDIDAHIPHAFGDWEPMPGLQAVRPPPDGFEAEIYNQEVSRAFVDKDGHVIMLMIAYGESQSDRLQLHHPEVCYTAQGFRVTRPVTSTFDWSASAPPIVLDPPDCDPRGSNRADQLLDADRLRRHEQQLRAQRAQAGVRPEGMDSGRRAVPRLDPERAARTRAFKIQDKFIRDLLNDVPPDTRTFMVGDPAKALLPARSVATTRGLGRPTPSNRPTAPARFSPAADALDRLAQRVRLRSGQDRIPRIANATGPGRTAALCARSITSAPASRHLTSGPLPWTFPAHESPAERAANREG